MALFLILKAACLLARRGPKPVTPFLAGMIHGAVVAFAMGSQMTPRLLGPDVERANLLTHYHWQARSIPRELLWYLSGEDHIRNLRQHTKIWDAWADEEGRLDTAYVHYWRHFPSAKRRKDGSWEVHEVDQIAKVAHALKHSPDSRRLVVTAWEPGNAWSTRLPPCHYTFAFQVLQGRLNCHLNTEPVTGGPVPIKDASIDWSRTIAWGDGGYYGRLFLNVKGREPEGVVEPADSEATRDELIAKLEAQLGPAGASLNTKVHKPRDVYPEVRGVAPDLIVYFGDLEWRSVGFVGNPSLYTYENDTGPDGANHDRDGIFIMTGAPGQPAGEVQGLNLIDVGPTILSLYGIESTEAFPGAVGRSFLKV